MFQRKRATALGTCDKNRTSNGAADVLYVLLKSLTALGLQALFFWARKIEMSRKTCARFAVDRWTQKKIDFKIVKTTADVRHALTVPSRFTVSKITKFPRWIFMIRKKVQITLVLLMFLSFRAIWKKGTISRLHWFYWCFWVFFRVKFEVKILCDFQNR